MERRTIFWVAPVLLIAPACEAKPKVAAFRDGDLIFQESSSRQSDMVRVLTRSRWTHVGVIFKEQGRDLVLEAASHVRRTPILTFVARGREQRYVVKRLRPEAGIADAAKLRESARSFIGRPYDAKFRWDDNSLYCSELVYKLFERALSIRLGKVQRADEMNLDDVRVRRAMAQRFRRSAFDPAEPVITPDALFNDARLEQVYP